jgi:hypothetical protein
MPAATKNSVWGRTKMTGEHKIKPENNPWYLLATMYGEPTTDELHARNRRAWNRYMSRWLDKGDRTLLTSRHLSEEIAAGQFLLAWEELAALPLQHRQSRRLQRLRDQPKAGLARPLRDAVLFRLRGRRPVERLGLQCARQSIGRQARRSTPAPTVPARSTPRRGRNVHSAFRLVLANPRSRLSAGGWARIKCHTRCSR